MLPPGDYEAAYKRIEAALAEGREDPESRHGSTSIPLSQFVRVTTALEAVNDPPAVLAHYGIDPAEWERARAAWLPLLNVVEVRARWSHWAGRIDIGAEVEQIRANRNLAGHQ
jgi:hypothetical protein